MLSSCSGWEGWVAICRNRVASSRELVTWKPLARAVGHVRQGSTAGSVTEAGESGAGGGLGFRTGGGAAPAPAAAYSDDGKIVQVDR